jgi:hypothetical protein
MTPEAEPTEQDIERLRQLHTMPAAEKKRAMQDMGYKNPGPKHKTNPGQKWWAPYSESYDGLPDEDEFGTAYCEACGHQADQQAIECLGCEALWCGECLDDEADYFPASFDIEVRGVDYGLMNNTAPPRRLRRCYYCEIRNGDVI